MTHNEFKDSIPYDSKCLVCTKDESLHLLDCCKGHIIMTINLMMDRLDIITDELFIADKRLSELENEEKML